VDVWQADGAESSYEGIFYDRDGGLFYLMRESLPHDDGGERYHAIIEEVRTLAVGRTIITPCSEEVRGPLPRTRPPSYGYHHFIATTATAGFSTSCASRSPTTTAEPVATPSSRTCVTWGLARENALVGSL
jgi:hypothetical protein